MKHPQGMNTYHGQAKDRQNWQRSINYRNELISKAESLNIKLHNPQSMKISDLESLVNNHRKTVDAKKNKWKYLTYSQIARLAGMKPQTLIHRIHTGMTLEEALLKPVQKRNSKTKLTTKQIAIAESNGITRKMISTRIMELDWPVEDAITLPKGTRRASLKAHQVDDEEEKELNMTKEERRALRKEKQSRRLQLLDKINELEVNGASVDEIKSLEMELANV